MVVQVLPFTCLQVLLLSLAALNWFSRLNSSNFLVAIDPSSLGARIGVIPGLTP